MNPTEPNSEVVAVVTVRAMSSAAAGGRSGEGEGEELGDGVITDPLLQHVDVGTAAEHRNGRPQPRHVARGRGRKHLT